MDYSKLLELLRFTSGILQNTLSILNYLNYKWTTLNYMDYSELLELPRMQVNYNGKHADDSILNVDYSEIIGLL